MDEAVLRELTGKALAHILALPGILERCLYSFDCRLFKPDRRRYERIIHHLRVEDLPCRRATQELRLRIDTPQLTKAGSFLQNRSSAENDHQLR